MKTKSKRKKLWNSCCGTEDLWSSLILWKGRFNLQTWSSGLRIWHSCSCGMGHSSSSGSIPGAATSICVGDSWERKIKKEILSPGSSPLQALLSHLLQRLDSFAKGHYLKQRQTTLYIALIQSLLSFEDL